MSQQQRDELALLAASFNTMADRLQSMVDIERQSKQALEGSGKLKNKIVTQIVPAGQFYAAEDYHQDYYLRNPIRYKYYRFNCGRDDRLKQLWGEAPAH